MQNIGKLSAALILSAALVFSGCWGGSSGTETPESSGKAITTFNFTSPAATGIITEADHTVAVSVPYGTNVTALVPVIVISEGASVNPASGTAKDFTNPVIYTVTGADGSAQDYTVTVTVAANWAKAITGFSFTGLPATGVVDDMNHTVSITLLRGTDVTALVPTITHNGAGISPGSGVVRNFTNPVTYAVTAADGSKQAYTVTLSFKTLIFADDGTGAKLWESDGTTAGTKLIKNITGYTGFVSPVNMNGRMYFRADNGTNGAELWVSDGTEAGTQMVKDLNNFMTNSGDPRRLIVMDNYLYFFATDRAHKNVLYKSDGTEAGTVPIGDVWVGKYEDDQDPGEMTAMNGRLFFAADDDIHGRELWVSDGTTGGTRMLKDIGGTSYDGGPQYFAILDSKIYFSGYDGYTVNGRELWVSDGTEDGTKMCKDINPTYHMVMGDKISHDGWPEGLTVANGSLFFSATDGTNGDELWMSDGTVDNTFMLKDINPAGSSGISKFTPMNGKVFFTLFNDNGNYGNELWVTDGTETGTKIVYDICPGSNGSSPANLTVMNSKLYFFANDGTNGAVLWVSDGTGAATKMVKNLEGSSSYYRMFEMNGRLFFVADDGTNGYELWVSDGTEAGTKMVKDINSSGDGFTPY